MCLSIAIHRPDDVLAKGEHCGFQWVVTNNGTGYRCGYVRIPAGHPWHGKDEEKIDCTVHGGLTFGEPDEPCEKPGPDDAYWLGFDCAHAWDLPDPELTGGDQVPDFLRRSSEGVVRSQEYVESECRNLCEQALAANA